MSDGISDEGARLEGDVYHFTGIMLRGFVTNQRLIVKGRDWTEGMQGHDGIPGIDWA